MPLPVNSNSFASYQESKQARRVQYIEAFLSVARKSRQKYDFVTDLARAVSHHISVNEKREGICDTECNPSTLLRNKRYKVLLLSYLADSAGPGLRNANFGASKVNAVEASTALMSQLETSNLRLENQRLKYHVGELERAGAAKDCISFAVTNAAERSEIAAVHAGLEFNYISTCQVVMAVLSRLQDVLTLDIENRRILDATVRRGNNVIADERLAGPFFDWLQKHAADK